LVATRAGAAEIVIEEGVTGRLVPTNDARALARALEPLMSDHAAATTMGERARQRVLDRFSLDAEARGIAAVYRKLI
jgi:mannosyltransferase